MRIGGDGPCLKEKPVNQVVMEGELQIIVLFLIFVMHSLHFVEKTIYNAEIDLLNIISSENDYT